MKNKYNKLIFKQTALLQESDQNSSRAAIVLRKIPFL
jgi:hypothetical protein